MARKTLTPEEREARRKARIAHSFSEAAYTKRYDASNGFGSAEEWIRQAESLASGIVSFAKPTTKAHPDLVLLYLDEMPEDVSGLKRAFRNAMFIAHPDHGGTNEMARDVMAAYKRLLTVFN